MLGCRRYNPKMQTKSNLLNQIKFERIFAISPITSYQLSYFFHLLNTNIQKVMSDDINCQQLMFKLIKLYVAQYLSTVHGFKNVQQEAINILALFVIQNVKKIALYVKRIISYQGVNMPNCLHIVDYLHQKKGLDIVKLIQFILKSHSNSNNKAMQSFYSGLQNLGQSIFSEDTEQINQHRPEKLYQNISYIPHQYTEIYEGNHFILRTSVDQGIKKPAQYSYKNIGEKVEKQQKNVEKLSSFAMREMRRSLGILAIQKQLEVKGVKGRKIQIGQLQNKQLNEQLKNKGMRVQFSEINFL